MRNISFIVSLFMIMIIGNDQLVAQSKIQKQSRQSEIKVPKAKDYSFKAVPRDTLEQEQEMKRYGDGMSWEEKYPDRDRRYRDPWREFRYESRIFFDRIGKELESFNLNESLGLMGGFNLVSVYTNKPDYHILNIRLNSPNKIDPVTITIVDPEGNLIHRKFIKEFDGEFLGQVNVGEGSSGSLFVLISQNDLSVSRKVELK